MKKPDHVIIFDTTLRDGEQCPGASMGMHEKLQVARQLEKLNVDIIEAGFPAASPGDFEAVKKVATEIKKCRIAGLARCVKRDIEQCAAARVILRPGVNVRVEPELRGLDPVGAQRVHAVDRAGGAAGVQQQFIHQKRPAFLVSFLPAYHKRAAKSTGKEN